MRNKWRYRASRSVVVFTDASFRNESIPEPRWIAPGCRHSSWQPHHPELVRPNFEGYDRLSQIDKSEWEVVEFDGLNAQEALQKFTSDPVNFRNTLKQLAASVSRSAETVAL